MTLEEASKTYFEQFFGGRKKHLKGEDYFVFPYGNRYRDQEFIEVDFPVEAIKTRLSWESLVGLSRLTFATIEVEFLKYFQSGKQIIDLVDLVHQSRLFGLGIRVEVKFPDAGEIFDRICFREIFSEQRVHTEEPLIVQGVIVELNIRWCRLCPTALQQE